MSSCLEIIAQLYKIGSELNQGSDKKTISKKYCETASKVLDQLATEVESYEQRLTALWVLLGFVKEYFPAYVQGPLTAQLFDKLFIECAKIVLNFKWHQIKDDELSKQSFQNMMEHFSELMKRNGYPRFALILPLLKFTWTNPVLSRLMTWDEEEKHDDMENLEGQQYIFDQDPTVLRLRLEMLLSEDCDDFALSLSGWCRKHPALREDQDILTTRLKLLHRMGYIDRLSKECRTITCHDGIHMIEQLQKSGDNIPLCTTLVQTFLVHDWMRPNVLHCCTETLVKLWVQYQLQADEDDESFADSVWAVAKLSTSSGQIRTLITGLREKRGDDLVQLYTYLFVFGLNLDKEVISKLSNDDNQDVLRAQLVLISDTCQLMGEIFECIHTTTAKACYLAAFSLQPSRLLIKEIRRCWTGPRISVSPEFDVKEENVDNATFKDQGMVSIASLYEVERLVEKFRLSFLDLDIKWEEMQLLCEKYLCETRRGLQCFSPTFD